MTAEARVERLLDWFGLGNAERSGLTVLQGHLDDSALGLERARYRNAANRVDEIVHCASSTSFSERKRPEVETTNVADLENILEFAAQSRCRFFHHVSTAYVAGNRSGPCEEELVDTQKFTNVYEETKYVGERIIKDRCEREGIALNIYRPSIVYGDSRTGRTIRFDAVYYPVKAVLFFKTLFEKDIREHGGHKARTLGITIDERGHVRLPLRIEATPAGGINLIPIDYFLEAFMAIMDDSRGGGVFHIVNTRLTTLTELADYTSRFFHVDGIRAVPGEAFLKAPRNGLELLFDHSIEAYGPYMRDTRVFRNEKTSEILEKKNVACPVFDYEMFSRCMGYAVDVNWGARLFEQVK